MARPRRFRKICKEPLYDSFIPEGISNCEEIVLSVDEYEVIRLIDLEKRTHDQCGKQMGISRTTVTEMYERAREKLADSIVNGKALVIAGGKYELCDGRNHCCHKFKADSIPVQKGKEEMRIAVTYEDGKVFQHFGHTAQFKFYDVENGQITKTEVVDTNGQGHGALSGFLVANKVNVVICGGIGGGAKAALDNAGIQLCGGITGNCDEAAQSYLSGSLMFNANISCTHHDHVCSEHSCGDGHDCGGHC